MPPKLVPLDDGRLHAELRRPNRRDIAGRSTANHDQINEACAIPPACLTRV